MTGSLLAGLLPEDRAEVDALRRREELPASSWLFRQGDEGECAYEVVEGELELVLALPGREALAVGIVGPGGWVGEPAIFGRCQRTLGAIARGRVVVDAFDRSGFGGLRHGLRPASLRLMLGIARLSAERLLKADVATTGPRPEACERAPAPSLAAAPASTFDPRPYLGSLPFFSLFSVREREELLRRGGLVDVERGCELLRRGQRTEGFGVVVRGAVEVLHPEHHARVGLLGPGSLFGHIGTLLGSSASADCRARERTTLLVFGRDAFARLLVPDEPLNYRFVEAMCRDLLDGLARADHVLAQFENLRRLQGSGAAPIAPDGA